MTTFKKFISEVIKPMFPGLEEPTKDSSQNWRAGSELVVGTPGMQALRVRSIAANSQIYRLSRKQIFDSSERALIKNLILAYDEAKKSADTYLKHLEDLVTRTAIAKSVCDGTPEQEETVADILELFSNWATQTYEGERVSSGVVIKPTSHGSDAADISFLELASEDFSKALSDGVDSWWMISANGRIREFSHARSQSSTSDQGSGFYPIRYEQLALKSNHRAVSITLNRNGEILVFAKSSLRFAKRRGRWIHFAHHSVIKQMASGGRQPTALRVAIYETCLDASFARSGACIGLLQQGTQKDFQRKKIVRTKDVLSSSKNFKPRAAQCLINGHSFLKIPRILRKELVGLDGAVVLQPNGHLYAAGAILNLENVKLGSQGGRSAAAKTLSHFGLGLKVSEDGMISGYKKELGDDEPAFKVG
jgi:hypothetical protein